MFLPESIKISLSSLITAASASTNSVMSPKLHKLVEGSKMRTLHGRRWARQAVAHGSMEARGMSVLCIVGILAKSFLHLNFTKFFELLPA